MMSPHAFTRGGTRVQWLTGGWKLAPDRNNVGREERWFAFGPVEEAREAPVPGTTQQVFPGYHGVVWYWHRFAPIASAAPNERYLLRFSSVDYVADVWLNGVAVGGHEGEAPFTLDVTNALDPGGDNLLAVRVLDPTENPIDGIALREAPGRGRGGVLLRVELVVAPAVRVVDIFARPEVDTGRIRVSITVRNDAPTPAAGQLTAVVGPASSGEVLDGVVLDSKFAPGETNHDVALPIAQPRLWDLDDPYLYRVVVALEAGAEDGGRFAHQQEIRCGFRDFRVADGYFRLDGKRLFLRSTHTANHVPIGLIVPPQPDLLRRDIIYAKASGFNMVRFLRGLAVPEQLDLCDEIGLMVYEESAASWRLEDSPKMAERFDRSVREMVRRDRNHPSVTVWGLLNETRDGPVFRHAVEALSLVRSLDDTRLVLLGSGRWDGQPGIGSVSNPGGSAWEHVWGTETPGAPAVTKSPRWDTRGFWREMDPPAYLPVGDAHVYPRTPQTSQSNAFLRTVGQESKPVFLSEYGIGSMMNVIKETRRYEQVGARPDLDDAALIRSMADRLEADWQRLGFDGVYPFPEDLLRESQRLHARQRLVGFDLIRSNPRLCGYNLTGMLDHGYTGEGLWTFWREWKPGIVDALADGWAPLRWCLFGDPLHGYVGRPVKLEAVLASEDALPPGEYPVRFRVSGPKGVAWDRRATVRIPEVAPGKDGPLALPVLGQEVAIDGPPGAHVFAANLERGGAPAGGRLKFHLSDAATLPKVRATVTVWGIDERIEGWLESRGIGCRRFEQAASGRREVILVGDLSGGSGDLAGWRELARRMIRGSAAIFLSPLAFQRGEDAVHWLPLANKGRCYDSWDWIYHKEGVAKRHPIFDGLQAGGIMDWDYYGQVFPHYLFNGQDTPADVAAAAFAAGFEPPIYYASGVLVGSYPFGAGHFTLNTLRVLENVGVHPAADRLLLNLINYAAGFTGEAPAELPEDFESRLMSIGYLA